MALFYKLLLSTCILSGFVSAAPTAENSFSISAYRDYADEQTRAVLSKRRYQQTTGNLSTYLDTSLYWFGQFDVGDATNLSLLIDTGSSDLILNHGEYIPSKYETPYNGDVNFSITYEGVDRQGFGFETVNGTLQNDIVSAGGLTVTQQVLGNVTSFQFFDVPPLPYAYQGQGIIGFAQGLSVFHPQGRPWFWSLCAEKIISVCRFGLAFGTSGIGQMIIGKLDSSLISGNVVSLPDIGGNGTYTVIGDVTLNNTIVLSNQTFIMDVGTDNIQSPIPQAQQLFELLNYPTQLLTEAPTPFDPGVTINVLNGFFDCTNPPTLGFSFPAQDQLEEGQTATIFNVSPDVWGVFNNSATNCTSILGGTNGIYVGNVSAWLLGQSFFAGHYIDFHHDNNNDTIISFANLANPSHGQPGGWSSW